MFDYGTKEGRAKALEELHNTRAQREAGADEDVAKDGGVGEEKGKRSFQHIEERH